MTLRIVIIKTCLGLTDEELVKAEQGESVSLVLHWLGSFPEFDVFQSIHSSAILQLFFCRRITAHKYTRGAAGQGNAC